MAKVKYSKDKGSNLMMLGVVLILAAVGLFFVSNMSVVQLISIPNGQGGYYLAGTTTYPYRGALFIGIIVGIIGLLALVEGSSARKQGNQKAGTGRMETTTQIQTPNPSPPEDTIISEKPWFCQDCGRENPTDTEFCGKCGSKKR